jgi:hypothetical protein
MRFMIQIFSDMISGVEVIGREGYDSFVIPSGGMKVRWTL